MTTIYAAYDGAIVWSDFDKIHKAGRVPQYEPLTVIRPYAKNWFIIERPENISTVPDPKYPDYYIYRTEIVEELPEDTIPEIDPEGQVTDTEAAMAILLVLQWLKQ